MSVILSKAQMATLSCVLQTFTWPGRSEPCVALIDSTFEFQAVHLLDAAKEESSTFDEEQEQIVEFGVDEDGGLWLFDVTQEDIDAGIFPESHLAVLDVVVTRVGRWTYRAAIRERTDVLVAP